MTDKQLVVKAVRRLPDDVDEKAPDGMMQVKGWLSGLVQSGVFGLDVQKDALANATQQTAPEGRNPT